MRFFRVAAGYKVAIRKLNEDRDKRGIIDINTKMKKSTERYYYTCRKNA
jgi:hypothetical protein